MLFVCYPKCTTCGKARSYLQSKGIQFEERNIKDENPKRHELEEWYRKSGLPLSKFFNTSGILYRELSLKDKLVNMSESEMLDLLSSNGMLVKRPILIADSFVLVGFNEKKWNEII